MTSSTTVVYEGGAFNQSTMLLWATLFEVFRVIDLNYKNTPNVNVDFRHTMFRGID